MASAATFTIARQTCYNTRHCAWLALLEEKNPMSGETWQLGPLTVEPEEKLRGVFPVDVGAARINFPIALVNGSEPDPVVLVTSGMDGDEYAGIEAALRLIDSLNPATLAGRVMICPILDPLSFEALHSQNPLDGLFLKHVFPGDLAGKPTQRLAYFIQHNFVRGADVWIDLHAVETSEEAIPFVWTDQNDDAQVNEQNRLLLHQSGAALGLLHAPGPWNPAQSSMVDNTALLVSQAGRRHQADEAAIKAHLSVVRGVLTGMDMLPGAKPHPPTIYLDHEPILAEHTGLWYPQVKAGDDVRAGQLLGEVLTLDGQDVQAQVKSTVEGRVLALHSGLATRPRLRLALIAHRPQTT